MARHTGRTRTRAAWRTLAPKVRAALDLDLGGLIALMKQMAVAGPSEWRLRAEANPVATTELLALVMVASRFSLDVLLAPSERAARSRRGRLLQKTELRRDGGLYREVRAVVDDAITDAAADEDVRHRQRDNLLSTLDRASELLPGLGFDPVAAAECLEHLGLSGGGWLIRLLRQGGSSPIHTLNRHHLPGSLAALSTREALDGPALVKLACQAERAVTDLDRPYLRAAIAAVLPEAAGRLVVGSGPATLSAVDGLSPASQLLWVHHAPVDPSNPPSAGTLRAGLRWFFRLDEAAKNLLASDPALLARPDEEPDVELLGFLWSPRGADPLLDPELLERVAITAPLMACLSTIVGERLEAAVARRVAVSGARHGVAEGYSTATAKLAYLVETLFSFARSGGYVDGALDAGPAPEVPPPSFVDRDWFPPEWLGPWMALGDLLHGRDNPTWRRVKAIVVFGCRPSGAALASADRVGRCGAGHQLYIEGTGAKFSPGMAGASAAAVVQSGFCGSWFEEPCNLGAMETTAAEVDEELRLLGLAVPPGEVLYRLRHGRAQAVAAVLAPGLESVVDALLQHVDIVATYTYTGLSAGIAHRSDVRRANACRFPTVQAIFSAGRSIS
jgi:hypothetical protein